MFWHNRGLRVFIDLFAADFSKRVKKWKWKVCRIQIKIYPQPSIEVTFGACYSSNEVRFKTWKAWMA